MIKKKINITIHPGYRKTGTTFLQRKFFNQLDLINLGEPYSNKEARKLQLLNSKIFQAKYSFDKFYPINYSYSIRNYADELASIIDSTEKKDFLLSNECIFDNMLYFGYYNFYILKEIIDLLKLKYDLNIKFIISIRKQHEILVSTYAFNYFVLKKRFSSLNNFLNELFNDPDLTEIYQYDILIEKLKKNFGTEILVLPVEELENQYETSTKIEDFLNLKFRNINNNNIKIRENSDIINNKKVHYLRSYDFRGFFYETISNLHYELKKFNIYKKNFKYLKIFKRFFMPGVEIKYHIQLEDSQIKEIQEHFKKSNQNLEKITNLELKKLGYY
tara:strand:+ start:1192 stop:2184 length:993 start_codon:yes stop_codon:yes gene_type:complete